MKPTKQIILIAAIVVFLGFVAFQIGLTLSSSQVLAAFGFIALIVGVLYYLSRSRSRSSSMSAAIRFLKQWWSDEFDRETLTREEIQGVEGYFGQQKFYSFRFRRLEGVKKGLWIKVILKSGSGGFDVSFLDESPELKFIESPFSPLDNEYIFSPVSVDAPIPQFHKNMPMYGRGSSINVYSGGPQPDEYDRMEGK